MVSAASEIIHRKIFICTSISHSIDVRWLVKFRNSRFADSRCHLFLSSIAGGWQISQTKRLDESTSWYILCHTSFVDLRNIPFARSGVRVATVLSKDSTRKLNLSFSAHLRRAISCGVCISRVICKDRESEAAHWALPPISIGYTRPSPMNQGGGIID